MLQIVLAIISSITAIAVAIIGQKMNKKADNISSIRQDFKTEINKISMQIDHNEKDHLRFEILSFAGDLRNGVQKTRQEFETIFAFHDKYEEIIKKLSRHNGYLDSEFDYIKEEFRKI